MGGMCEVEHGLSLDSVMGRGLNTDYTDSTDFVFGECVD